MTKKYGYDSIIRSTCYFTVAQIKYQTCFSMTSLRHTHTQTYTACAEQRGFFIIRQPTEIYTHMIVNDLVEFYL